MNTQYKFISGTGEPLQAESHWHDIGELAVFCDGEARPILLHGVEIAVVRVADQLFALRDQCTHGAARLSEGFVENGCIECPLHQGTFDLRTGLAVARPAKDPVRTFPIRIIDGRVQLQFDPRNHCESPTQKT